MKLNIEGRDALIEGLNVVCEAILSTMGPMGRKVCIPDSKGNPTFSRDGVTVAEALKSPFDATDGDNWRLKNMGAKLVVDACERTVKAGGDGTTTTASLVKGMLSNITASGEDVNYLVKELKKAVDDICSRIDGMSRKPNHEELIGLTTVSANNNKDLGKMIADLVFELGEDAYIEPVAQMGDTKTEIIKGYDLGSGFMIPEYKSLETSNFSENIAGKGNHIWLANPYIMLIEESIKEYQALVPVYKAFRKTMTKSPSGKNEYPRALVIIASEVSEDALQFVVGNLFPRKATDVPVPVFILRSPDQASDRYESMKDIQVAVDSKMVFSNRQGRPLRLFEGIKDFGTCLRAEVTMDNCRMILSKETEKAVDRRIEEIKSEVKDENAANKRIGKLSKGIGLITIGGYTQAEYNYLNQVIEDAVLAAISAMKYGVVPGAGKALCLASKDLTDDKVVQRIMFQVCICPAISILQNAGFDTEQIDMIIRHTETFNVLTGAFESIETTSILDSAEVVKSALKHAMSLAAEISQSKYAIRL